MSLTVSNELLAATTSSALQSLRKDSLRMSGDREVQVRTDKLDNLALQDLMSAATSLKDTKTARAVESIALARTGAFDKKVPNFKAFQGVLEAFLKTGRIDGWIYVTGSDGKLYPQLVTAISFDEGFSRGRQGTPSISIHTCSYGFSQNGNYETQFRVFKASHVFEPQQVANRRVADILAAGGIFKETPALREAHAQSLARHEAITQKAFSQQFRVNGAARYFENDHYSRRSEVLANRRVIHDMEAQDYGAAISQVESFLFDDDAVAQGLGPVPEHPVIRVFDLRTHEFFWVHADNMTPYQYDKSLREKLILPPTHRDLLDVLTTDIEAFVNDIIDGKSAGNVILCKGIPGVGKTLTAEVYAELIERPLYSIHSGSLGTTAKAIEQNLREIFQRGKRWGCVLLLDEADVFVVQRGNNLEQNAIVAEFLRTLEYFDGLLFATTNRPDDIDEAIISRCAAIIDYAAPNAKDAAAIWRVMATQYKADLSDELIGRLVGLFPEIAPRDIKMLFRLALRVAGSHNEPLSLDTFRRCAMFRAIKIQSDV